MKTRRDVVLDIHKSDKKIVLAVTGGGSEVIGELLRHGSGSKTTVEATVPYEPKTFDAYIKGKPDKYCSADAARDLAMASYQRAVSYQGKDAASKLIGVGVSCALIKAAEREGRAHHAFIALQTATSTKTFTVDLAKFDSTVKKRTLYYLNEQGELEEAVDENEDQDREREETVVSDATLAAIAKECGIEDLGTLSYVADFWTQEDCNDESNLLNLLIGVTPKVKIKNENLNSGLPNRIIFAGSFNPIHDQHKKIANTVFNMEKYPVNLEVCVHNADKAALNFLSLKERKTNLLTELENEEWFGMLYFTSLRTFLEKALHFPDVKFVVGWDTAVRICDPKYANLNDVFSVFKQQRSKFLIFHRIIDGIDSSKSGQILLPELMEISQVIPTNILPAVEMSSSQIRNTK